MRRLPAAISERADGPGGPGPVLWGHETLQSTPGNAPARVLEAELEAAMNELLRHWPVLVGFSVQNADQELRLTEVAVHPSPGHEQYSRLSGEIAQALLELIDERPEALELLRGRTFARALH